MFQWERRHVTSQTSRYALYRACLTRSVDFQGLPGEVVEFRMTWWTWVMSQYTYMFHDIFSMGEKMPTALTETSKVTHLHGHHSQDTIYACSVESKQACLVITMGIVYSWLHITMSHAALGLHHFSVSEQTRHLACCDSMLRGPRGLDIVYPGCCNMFAPDVYGVWMRHCPFFDFVAYVQW